MPYVKQTFDLREVLAVAAGFNELNFKISPETNGYVQSSFPLGDEAPEGYDFTYDEELFAFSSRDLVKEHFGLGTLNRWHPEKNNIPTVEINDELLAKADEIIKYFNKLMFDALAGNLKDFKSAMYDVINKDDGVIEVRELGIVAAIPSAMLNDIAFEKRKRKERELASTSEYIGLVGTKLDIEIDITSSKYIEKFECYVYNAVHAGVNAVSFFTQKSPEQFGKKCKINGKVKRCNVNDYTKAKETVLNYVKVDEILEK